MAFINGKLEVEKWLHNTAVENFTDLNILTTTNTRVGSIGLYNGILYYRATSNSVLPLVTINYLENVINNIDVAGDIINNIDFINGVINSVLDSITNNNDFISTILNSILAKANVEIRSLKGKTLFFAFDPNNLDNPNTPVLPPASGTCNNPTSVNLVGNFTPAPNSTETYDINVVGSSDYLITFSIIGGTPLTSVHESPIQVNWLENFEGLSSISVGVGCVNDVINSKYDFKFFTVGDKVSEDKLQLNSNNVVEVIFKYGLTKQAALLSTQNISYYLFGNSLQINDIIYSDNLLQIRANSGFYLKNSVYYEVVNGVIIAIE